MVIAIRLSNAKSNSELNTKLDWIVVGGFSDNGTVTLNRSIVGMSEITIQLFLGRPRLNPISDNISRLIQYGLQPDFMSTDGRIYCTIEYVDGTHLKVSDLHGLSDYSGYAQMYILIR